MWEFPKSRVVPKGFFKGYCRGFFKGCYRGFFKGLYKGLGFPKNRVVPFFWGS